MKKGGINLSGFLNRIGNEIQYQKFISYCKCFWSANSTVNVSGLLILL